MSLTKPGTTEGFAYDAIGRQVNKSVNGVLTGYYLDGDQMMIEKVNGAITAQYVWGNGLARCNGEYPLTDGRGNVRQSTNASQSITSANAPTAFGIGSVTGGTASAYSYGASSGYRQDGVAPAGLPGSYSLQKVGARYYDPAVGGFLTRDTELDELPYAYCNGDPVNRVDPSGHKMKLVTMTRWILPILHGYGSYRVFVGKIEIFIGGAAVIRGPSLPTRGIGAVLLAGGIFDVAVGRAFTNL